MHNIDCIEQSLLKKKSNLNNIAIKQKKKKCNSIINKNTNCQAYQRRSTFYHQCLIFQLSLVNQIKLRKRIWRITVLLQSGYMKLSAAYLLNKTPIISRTNASSFSPSLFNISLRLLCLLTHHRQKIWKKTTRITLQVSKVRHINRSTIEHAVLELSKRWQQRNRLFVDRYIALY